AGGAATSSGVEELNPPPPPLLGAVHGCVGVSQQGLCRITGSTNGDTKTGGDVYLLAVDRQLTGHGLDQAFTDAVRLPRAPDSLAHDDELVAAESGDGVTGPHGLAQTLGDGHQHAVAGRVTPAVVDELESVEVEEEDGD